MQQARGRQGAPAGEGYQQESARGLQETVELLVDGGYHRARISALDPFDKVAGGLAWGIQCARENIDVEFTENANIGHKLKIGENIENALVAMRCPHELLAHQIQGLDFPKIGAVLRWLLQRVKRVRKEQAVSIWRHAELCFARTFGPYPGERVEQRLVRPPPRKFRRAPDEDISTEQKHVASVLLEYGHTYQVRADLDIEAMAEDEDEGKSKEALRKLRDEQEEERRAMEELLGGMAACRERSKVSAQAVNGLVGQQGDAIAKHAQAHDERMARLREAAEDAGAERSALARRREELQRKEQEHRREQQAVAAAQEAAAAAREEQARAEKEAGKKERRLQRIADELQRLRAELESDPEKRAVFEGLLAAKARIDELRDEAEQLRESCELRARDWKRQIAEAQAAAEAAAAESADPERMAELRGALAHSEDKLRPAQRIVAKRSREIVKVQRAIDEIPTRAELTQYEKRFSELYEQVSWKFQETKQYYNQYNVASDTQKYLEQERSLIRSVEGQLESVMAPKESLERKAALAKSINDIVAKVDAGKGKTQGRLSAAKERLDALLADYQRLIDVQRRYYHGIQSIQEEFARGEHLRSRLAQLSAALQAAEGPQQQDG